MDCRSFAYIVEVVSEQAGALQCRIDFSFHFNRHTLTKFISFLFVMVTVSGHMREMHDPLISLTGFLFI